MLNTIRKANLNPPPMKVIVYGVHGVGKTSLGATFPKPVLLPIEEGASYVDIDSFPKLNSFAEVVEAINALHQPHDFKTVVVDSLDWLEPLVWAQTCAVGKKGSIEEFGYGKGYIEAEKQWEYLMAGFDSLRAKGMHIVLLAHSEIRTFSPPDANPYDKYQMRVHKRACATWQEWADGVFFVTYKVAVVDTASGKSRGLGSGDRVIYTDERPTHDAKNRWSLPSEIIIGKDKTWNAFHAALSEATGGHYTQEVK